MDTRRRSTRVVMFPWLAHGHITPFLHLAISLSTKNFITYICSSPINLNSIKKNLSPQHSISIKLVELQIPPTPTLPHHHHTTNALPPHLMSALKLVFDSARPAFSSLLATLKPDLVFYDFLQPWAPQEAHALNIPAVLFLPTGAAAFSLIMYHYQWYGCTAEYPFPEIYFRESEYSVFSRLIESGEDGDRVRECIERSCDVVLIRSFADLETKYIDFLSGLSRKKFVSVGPLIHDMGTDGHPPLQKSDHHIVEWLDGKDVGSTVFASFGSEYFLSENEIEEIAYGLEMSGVNFIWVVRFPVGERVNIEEKLPLGFAERVRGRGMVVEGWAPQRAILSHRNVGGFVSHCGWSSVMEGVYSGVPIIAVPMHLDQPLNARLVEEGGFGEEVVRGRDGNLDRGEVARVVKKVVVEESGERVRRRAAEMREKMRERGEEKVDEVVKELMRLCWRRERLNLEREDSMSFMVKREREGMLSENA